ncbi:MAG: ATP-binding cassette domain-containing protein [Legionellales bacterium]|nr:ATP-binding cassette domain-containing protein [Legionellales bacterium]
MKSSDQKVCVSVEDVSYCWFEKQICKNISLEIPRGKITAIMGPSGTGKTTILRLIGGQLFPKQGNILFDGINIHKLKQKELLRIRERMGLLFQNAALFSNISVFDNVAFPYIEHTNLSKNMIYQLVNTKLEVVGLRGARNLMPNELSGGMARRVAIARALALDPILMMFDEPFVGQDPITVGILIKLMEELNRILGMTIIIVSHDVEECFQLADYIYIISGGRILGEGTVNDIRSSKSQEVNQFIHGEPDGAIPFHYASETFSKDILNVS